MSLVRYAKWGACFAGAVALAYTAVAATRCRRLQLTGKTVLITGGSRGLGLILARRIGAAGARIVICARHADQLQRAEQELTNAGVATLAVQCDVTDRAAVKALVQHVENCWGPVDIAINNAGVIQMGPLDSQTESDFEAAMNTHFWGPLNVMSEVVPGMRRRGGGRIVNIASVGGKTAVPHLVPYCASKFALVGLSEGFAAELARDGIVVTTVCPGLMRTGSPRNAIFKGRHREEYAWFSIAGSLPIMSIDAGHAADQIIGALCRGEMHAVLGFPAKVACVIHDLFPDILLRGYAAINELLPRNGGIGRYSARGAESESALSPSFLTSLTERAALANNELD